MMHIANFPWSLEFLYKFHKTHLTILIDPNVKSIYKENKEYGDITNKDEDGDEGKRPVGFEREISLSSTKILIILLYMFGE